MTKPLRRSPRASSATTPGDALLWDRSRRTRGKSRLYIRQRPTKRPRLERGGGIIRGKPSPLARFSDAANGDKIQTRHETSPPKDPEPLVAVPLVVLFWKASRDSKLGMGLSNVIVNGSTKAVVVAVINHNGPLARTKLKVGMVISSVNGEQVATSTEAAKAIKGVVGEVQIVAFRASKIVYLDPMWRKGYKGPPLNAKMPGEEGLSAWMGSGGAAADPPRRSTSKASSAVRRKSLRGMRSADDEKGLVPSRGGDGGCADPLRRLPELMAARPGTGEPAPVGLELSDTEGKKKDGKRLCKAKGCKYPGIKLGGFCRMHFKIVEEGTMKLIHGMQSADDKNKEKDLAQSRGGEASGADPPWRLPDFKHPSRNVHDERSFSITGVVAGVIQSKDEEIALLKAQLKNLKPIAETVDLTSEETEPPAKRPRTENLHKSNLTYLHDQNRKIVKVKKEKVAAEIALSSAREAKDAALADLNEAKEDLEDSNDLIQQQALAIDIWQRRFDELAAFVAGQVDGAVIAEIRNRSLASGF